MAARRYRYYYCNYCNGRIRRRLMPQGNVTLYY